MSKEYYYTILMKSGKSYTTYPNSSSPLDEDIKFFCEQLNSRVNNQENLFGIAYDSYGRQVIINSTDISEIRLDYQERIEKEE